FGLSGALSTISGPWPALVHGPRSGHCCALLPGSLACSASPASSSLGLLDHPQHTAQVLGAGETLGLIELIRRRIDSMLLCPREGRRGFFVAGLEILHRGGTGTMAEVGADVLDARFVLHHGHSHRMLEHMRVSLVRWQFRHLAMALNQPPKLHTR